MEVEGVVVKDDAVHEYGFVELRKSHTGESYQNQRRATGAPDFFDLSLAGLPASPWPTRVDNKTQEWLTEVIQERFAKFDAGEIASFNESLIKLMDQLHMGITAALSPPRHDQRRNWVEKHLILQSKSLSSVMQETTLRGSNENLEGLDGAD
jgi:hypothetical protein